MNFNKIPNLKSKVLVIYSFLSFLSFFFPFFLSFIHDQTIISYNTIFYKNIQFSMYNIITIIDSVGEKKLSRDKNYLQNRTKVKNRSDPSLNHSVLSTDRGIRVTLLGHAAGQRILLVALPLPRPATFPLLILVRLHVFRQVIAPHEPFPARRASEPLLPGVRAQMTLQLVAPGEPLAAEQPVAYERAFAGVPSEMRLQMGRLPVHFAATGHVAHVLPLPVQA